MTTPRVLLLSRKPLTERPLHEWLPEVADGLVLVMPSRMADCAPPDIRCRYLSLLATPDYRSWATELIAERAARTFGVGLVASSSEDDVLRCARLRRRLGLPGQSERSALAYRDKLVMRETAAQGGVRVPPFRAIADPVDLLHFIEDVGLPVVAKPRRSSGSVGVSFLTCPADVKAFLESGALSAAPRYADEWLAESLIKAPLFHVDGIAADGKVLHSWPSRYSDGNAEAVQRASILSSVMLAPDDPLTQRLQDFAAAVASALPAPPLPTSFHLEAWIGADGEPILCEVASRPGGGPIAETYKAAFGAHLSKENLRGQSGLEISLRSQTTPVKAFGWVLFPPEHGVFTPPALLCPVPDVLVRLALTPGTTGQGVAHAGDAAATAIVSADSSTQLAARIEAVMRWWRESRPWR